MIDKITACGPGARSYHFKRVLHVAAGVHGAGRDGGDGGRPVHSQDFWSLQNKPGLLVLLRRDLGFDIIPSNNLQGGRVGVPSSACSRRCACWCTRHVAFGSQGRSWRAGWHTGKHMHALPAPRSSNRRNSRRGGLQVFQCTQCACRSRLQRPALHIPQVAPRPPTPSPRLTWRQQVQWMSHTVCRPVVISRSCSPGGSPDMRVNA